MWIRCSGSHTPKGLGCHPLLVNPLRHIGPLRTVRVEGSRSAVSSAPSPCPSSTALAASARSPKPGWGLLPTRAPLPHRQVLPAAASITAARTRRVKHSALEPRAGTGFCDGRSSKSLRVALRTRAEKAGPTLGPAPRSFKSGRQLRGQRCRKAGALGGYNAKRKTLPLPSSVSVTEEVTRRGGPLPGAWRSPSRALTPSRGDRPAATSARASDASPASSGCCAVPRSRPAPAPLDPPDTARGGLAIVRGRNP